MSRIKELKEQKETQINLIDALELFCEDKKSKYIETIYRIIKNTPDIEKFAKEVKKELKDKFGADVSPDSDLSAFQLAFYYKFIDSMFNTEDLKTYNNFCRYNERGLISNNDLSSYKVFSQIEDSVNEAELKLLEKDLEKQIKMIYSDEEWMVLRPLTYLSSKKYGASTKWCTKLEDTAHHFLRYTKRGILIYMLNRKTGLRVACFKSLNDDPEYSFWNQADERIDSIQSGLPHFIKDIIAKEIDEHPVTNISLLSKEERKRQESLDTEKKMAAVMGERDDHPEPIMEEEDMVDREEEEEETEQGLDTQQIRETENPPIFGLSGLSGQPSGLGAKLRNMMSRGNNPEPTDSEGPMDSGMRQG